MLQHLVVAATGEEDFACVELVEGTSDGPHVDCGVGCHSEDNFRRAVVSGDEVWCDFVSALRGTVVVGGSGAEIADFKTGVRLVDEDVVWFEIRVEDVAFAEERGREEHLSSVFLDGADIDAHIAAIALDDFAEVERKIFEDHAEVAFVLEVAEEADEVFLVVWVGLGELFEDTDFFKTGFLPVDIVSNV